MTGSDRKRVLVPFHFVRHRQLYDDAAETTALHRSQPNCAQRQTLITHCGLRPPPGGDLLFTTALFRIAAPTICNYLFILNYGFSAKHLKTCLLLHARERCEVLR